MKHSADGLKYLYLERFQTRPIKGTKEKSRIGFRYIAMTQADFDLCRDQLCDKTIFSIALGRGQGHDTLEINRWQFIGTISGDTVSQAGNKRFALSSYPLCTN